MQIPRRKPQRFRRLWGRVSCGIIRAMSKKQAAMLFGIGLLLLCVALLGTVQLAAQQRFLTRGWVSDAPTPLPDTSYPPLCVNASLEQYDAEQLAWALDLVADGGFTWVRQHFPWSEIEPAPGQFEWAQWDAIVAGAVERGVQLLPVLTSPPAWAGMPPDPEAFAHFAGALANHYAAQLSYYQIWHNPNLGDAWGGAANPVAYAELLAHAAPAIRAADPDARMVLGGLAPTVEDGPINYSEPRFLELLVAAGASPYYDVVAVQPLGFDAGPEDRRVAVEVRNFARAVLIREAMEALGEEGKAVWATLVGWNSLPEAWPGPPSIWGQVDATTQAAYTVAALERAETEWPWMGVFCVNGLQPRPADSARTVPDAEEHWGFAMIGPDGAPRPLYTALQGWAARPVVARPGVYPASSPLATYAGGWRLGPLGADIPLNADARLGDARASFTFEGNSVALTVRRGPYLAFLFVTVDGAPASALPRDEEGRAYVVLYDPLAEVATVPLATGLPDGIHTVELIADRGWYQWALADWRVWQAPPARLARLGEGTFAALGVLGAALMALAARRVDWRGAGAWLWAAYARLGAPMQTALTAMTGALFGFAAWMVWAQGAFRRLGDGPGLAATLLAAGLFYFSPWVAVMLVSGALLFLLVWLQPGLGLALTIAAAPFYLHPVSLFGRSFALSELLLLPTLVGCAARILAARRRGEHLALHATLLPVGALLLTAALSTALAAHRREALRELRLVILEPALFYAALLLTPLEKGERRRILDFWLASVALIAVIGLVQYFVLGDVITAEGGMRRLRSIYGSPNNVGLYLGRAWPVLLAELWRHWRVRRGSPRFWLTAGALGVSGLALLLSLSRGAILLGIPAGLLTLGLLAGGRWRKVTLVGLLVLIVVLAPLFVTPRFAALLNPASGTAFLRVSLWRSTWAMFREHPLLGVGPDNFLYAYRTRYILPTAWEEFNLSHPHNWPLDVASRLGVLGLGVFLALQGGFWRRVRILRRLPAPEWALAVGLAASMAVALAHGLVDAAFFYVDLAYVFYLTLAAVVWLEKTPAR